ncbi:MAG: hypothetical protein KGV43_00485 [Arcobacter sp.]|nr:hypothetical protein [Arcobacter sp.]
MRFLIIFFLLINILFAKKDFYYSFINSSGSQISEKQKQEVRDGFEIIQNVKNLAKEGRIDDAYEQIKRLKDRNKLKILESDIIVTFSDISLKKVNKRFIMDAEQLLENAVNSSKINTYNLSQAYILLVELKLALNKITEAKYFANTIINSFSDNLTKTYGKIQLAKIYKHMKKYKNSIVILYDILTKTKDKLIATIVADELFDLYLLNNQRNKAKELISKVLKSNISYYANDSYLANKKIDRLIKADMPEYASEILEELLNQAKKDEDIESFKFKLANVYMLMYDKTNFYLEKAKELYKDIIGDYSTGPYFKKSKMYLDEILMRQGVIKPSVIAQKYSSSSSMEQKALMQELLNDKKAKKFEKIFEAKKVYMKISDTIAKRFDYKSMKALFDEINIEMIKDFINKDNCSDVHKALQNARDKTIIKLIKSQSLKYKFFECLIEVPYEKAYFKVKDFFNSSYDADIYLYLERMAYSLGLLDEALKFSTKVEMLGNKDVLAREFLEQYRILKAKKDALLLKKFFIYASRNKDYINKSMDNPLIIDFFYDYYFYLLNKGQKQEAFDILKKLYDKQMEVKANVYSPFVEMELANEAKNQKDDEKALKFFLEAVKNTRRMKADDKVKIYYDILKLYDKKKEEDKKEEYLLKCKEVKGTSKDNLYKKMCDEM